jgi:hypothetical protein
VELIQCVKIEANGVYIVGDFAELHTLIDNIVPDAESIEEGETVTITFPKMTQQELDALPEFEG